MELVTVVGHVRRVQRVGWGGGGREQKRERKTETETNREKQSLELCGTMQWPHVAT